MGGSAKVWYRHVVVALSAFLGLEVAEVEELLWRSRRPSTFRGAGSPDGLRGWLHEDKERHGFPSWRAYAKRLGLASGQLINFLGGRVKLLSRRTIERIAAARGVSTDYLLQMHGPLTAEEIQRQMGRRNIAAFNQRYPAGHPRRREITQAARDGRRAHPDIWRAHHSRALALGALKRLADNKDAMLCQREWATTVLELGWVFDDLASRANKTRRRVTDVLDPSRSKIPPNDVTIRWMEEALGKPLSPRALQEIKAARSASGAGRRMKERHRREQDRISKWSGAKLRAELRKLGPDVPPSVVAEAQKLSWEEPVRAEGSKLWRRAKMALMRAQVKTPFFPAPAPKGPGGHLRDIRNRLAQQVESRIFPWFQCQACPRLSWRKPGSRTDVVLCNRCWHRYGAALGNWKRHHPNLPQPPAPRGKGRRLTPEVATRRVLSLLDYRLGLRDTAPYEAELKALQRVEGLLGRSEYPRARRIILLLDQLA